MRSILDIKKKYYNRLDTLDLEIIISHIIQKPREFILSHPEFELDKKQILKIEKLIKRRIDREPIAYITNRKEFYNLNFFVNKSVLIPRPETELIIDEVLREAKKSKTKKLFIDVGTGSGCIIITLAKNLQNSSNSFIGLDVSKEALRVARKNSKDHKTSKKIKFIYSNLLNKIIDKLSKEKKEVYLIANLPYLSENIYSSTSKDVKNYEPKKALISPEKGLHHYKLLAKQIKKILILNPNLKINIYLEFSPEQTAALAKFIKHSLNPKIIKIKKDLARKNRLMIIKNR